MNYILYRSRKGIRPRGVIIEALRAQHVPEYLVKAIMATYEGSKAAVSIDGNLSEEFSVNVGVHQGSILSPLLFIIVMKYVTESARHGDLLELLYADDIALGDETVAGVLAKYEAWKKAMERKGLRVNVSKTKGLSVPQHVEVRAAVDPCSVCGKRVGRNSILCTKCKLWTHKRCTNIRGSLKPWSGIFTCAKCCNPPASQQEEPSYGELECVKKFTYLGHCLDATGGCEIAISQRIQAAWSSFRQLRGSLLGRRGLSFKQRGIIYSRCVRPVLLYSSETWCATTASKQRLKSAENRMIRMMCNVTLADRIPTEVLRNKLEIARDVLECLEMQLLRWFGHVFRRDESNPIKLAYNLQVEGSKPRGRPKKTWHDTVLETMKSRNLKPADALDRDYWRLMIQERTANLS